MNLYLLLVTSLAWLAWVPAAVLEKQVKNLPGGTSIFPIIPLFPLAAWVLGYMLNLASPQLGLALVGGGHVLLLLAFVFSIARSLWALRKVKGQSVL